MAENDLTSTGNLDTMDSHMKRFEGSERAGKNIFNEKLPLQGQFPSSFGDYRLSIAIQPEDQHRARYLTEGSRGPVKDRLQQGYPQIQVILHFDLVFSHTWLF